MGDLCLWVVWIKLKDGKYRPETKERALEVF